MANKESSLNKESIIKWIVTSVIVPILCASVSIFIAMISLEKPVTYVYKEVSNLDMFVTTEYFPLQTGNYWKYSYNTKETIPNSNEIKKTNGTLKMTVEKVHKYDNCELIELKGNIFSGNPDELYGILIITNKLYYISNDKLNELINSLDNKFNLTYEFFLDITTIFEFPLFNGQIYGDKDTLIRNDLKYAWNVSKSDGFLTEINNKLEENSVYTLKRSTNPDDELYTFIPYVGITSYEYHHHGTIEDIEMELLEYKVNVK